MAVTSGFVGSSAKLETGKEWMSEARKELRLSPNGWMSEMVGKSTEVRFVNTVNRTQANIHALMGSPTAATVYIFENTATISATTHGGWALQTGAFPAGSTLKIINRGSIRGGGGNGGGAARNKNGVAGGTALILNFPATIDNTSGSIWGGGGGGGTGYNTTSKGGVHGAGGGGAGTPAGLDGQGGIINYPAKAGTSASGGKGGRHLGGNGGGLGGAGDAGRGKTMSDQGKGGRGGYSVQTNGNTVTWIAVGDRIGAVV